MRLHEAAALLRSGQRLRMSEINAVEPLDPKDERPAEGYQEAGTRRWWTPALTDAQILAYWNRIVLKLVRLHGGNEVFVIVTPTDGAAAMKGEAICE